MKSPPLDAAPESAFLIAVSQIFLGLFLFLALLYGVRELALFTLVILLLGLMTGLWSRAGLKNLSCNISLSPNRLFAGQKLQITFRAANSGFLPLLLRTSLFLPKSAGGDGKGRWIAVEASLLWFQQVVLSETVTIGRRGVYDLGPPQLRGGDPFGFHLRYIDQWNRFEVVVYPRIVGIRSIPVPKRDFYGIPGTRSPVEDPVYVFGTRNYRPGRPARGIHWKASARHDRLQEKLCEPAEQEKVLLLVDVAGFEAADAENDFERILEVVAAVALQINRRGAGIGLVTNGGITGNAPRIVPISRTPRQLTMILETLARLRPETVGGPICSLLSKGYPIPFGVSGLCFSHARNDGTRAIEAYLGRRRVPAQWVLVRKSNDPSFATTGDRSTPPIYLSDLKMPEVAIK
jgi:uncharacterized protein (DUF58 family)